MGQLSPIALGKIHRRNFIGSLQIRLFSSTSLRLHNNIREIKHSTTFRTICGCEIPILNIAVKFRSQTKHFFSCPSVTAAASESGSSSSSAQEPPPINCRIANNSTKNMKFLNNGIQETKSELHTLVNLHGKTKKGTIRR